MTEQNSSTVPLQDKPLGDLSAEEIQLIAKLRGYKGTAELAKLTLGVLNLEPDDLRKIKEIINDVSALYDHKQPEPYNLFSGDASELDRRTWAAMGSLILRGVMPAPNIEGVDEYTQTGEAIQQLREKFWQVRDTLKTVEYLGTGDWND